MSIKARPVKGTVRLNNNYNNVIKFNNAAEKFEYLESVEEGFQYFLGQSPDINFNIGDTINTSIVMDYSKWGDDLNSALNRNYLVVADSNFPLLYYFYFIVGAAPLNRGTVRYDLELDVFTTYNINGDYEIDDFVVGRAHQDRFTEESTSNSYEFNLERKAPAQAPDAAEESWNSKFPSKKISPDFDRVLCETDFTYDWFKQNPGWLVAFITGEGQGTEVRVGASQRVNYMPYGTYVAPLTTMKVRYHEIEPYSYYWSAARLYALLNAGTKTDTAVSFMITQNCPINVDIPVFSGVGELNFDFAAYESWYAESTSRNQEIFRSDILDSGGAYSSEFAARWALIDVDNLVKESEPISAEDLGILLSFQNASKEDKRSAEKEPKFLKKNMTELSITNINGGSYEAGLFETSRDFTIKKVEMVNPETITTFTTFNGGDYSQELYDANIGLSKKSVLDLPVVENTYLNYIRSNKNAMMTGLVIPLAETAVGTVASAASAGLLGSFAAAAGGGMTASGAFNMGGAVGSGVMNAASGAANYYFEMDNLKSTPDTVRSFSNDYLFAIAKNRSVSDYIEIYELKDKEKEMAFEYFYKYGYAVQERRNSKELFGRYIFNYIQAMDSTADKIVTKVPMSNLIKDTIENILAKGVTFWNYDSGKLFDYSYENYESRLFDTEETK